ncbi:class A beta-lactamase [Hymenobacter busanensis]|uniref:beta-lactamase n=1 Tax=Hymenobacter busanensis TaxID=2607656 RepID=A0A7L4ZWA7_9BACT|nr:class A beta-lactamase [Hymenobacter busanensis]KAA9332163.1 class A beta-lactamase [Hymenobacter busanensis]QHJ07498.1 class A beta-lactamase [Hymenobacter busanensis]
MPALARILVVFFLLTTLPGYGQQPAPTPTLAQQFAALAKPAGGRVGAAATLVETGETVTLAGAEHFPMQSVFKLPIAMLVIHQVEQGKLRWTQRVRLAPADMRKGHSPLREQHPQGTELTLQELTRYMVSESDNSACDKLLSLIGGPAAVTQYLKNLGLSNVLVATTEGEMAEDELAQYRSWASPAGMAGLLVAVQKGKSMSAANHALLLRYLTNTTRGQARLKGLLPAGTMVAHKTGGSGTSKGLTRATNDVGIITLPNQQHLAVAVFVTDSRATEAVREGVIARIAQAAYLHWTGAAKPR